MNKEEKKSKPFGVGNEIKKWEFVLVDSENRNQSNHNSAFTN